MLGQKCIFAMILLCCKVFLHYSKNIFDKNYFADT